MTEMMVNEYNSMRSTVEYRRSIRFLAANSAVTLVPYRMTLDHHGRIIRSNEQEGGNKVMAYLIKVIFCDASACYYPNVSPHVWCDGIEEDMSEYPYISSEACNEFLDSVLRRDHEPIWSMSGHEESKYDYLPRVRYGTDEDGDYPIEEIEGRQVITMRNVNFFADRKELMSVSGAVYSVHGGVIYRHLEYSSRNSRIRWWEKE